MPLPSVGWLGLRSGAVMFDFHTHKVKPDAIVSISPCDDVSSRVLYSVGVHPWMVADAGCDAWSRIDAVAREKNVVAIGETGLDKLRGPAISLQAEAFERHVSVSESVGKPLIIHCVRAYNELMSMRRRLSPSQAWVVHGFRGKPELARQLVDAGFLLSLGAKFNAATAMAIPSDKLLIESDESDTDVASIYRSVAAARNQSVPELERSVDGTLQSLGISVD